jgi:putative endonuclease
MKKAEKQGCFWIYMLECNNGSYYTGYTNNIARRFRLHHQGKAGVRYTRSHPAVRIAQCWRLFDTVGTALKVEFLIKRKPRAVKDRLVEEPARLATIASRTLDRKLRLFTTDPVAVEAGSFKLTEEQLKNGHDPFADLAPEDMEVIE